MERKHLRTAELRAFGLDNLTWTGRPEPKPGPGEVLVRMRAWSLNYRDLLVIKGHYNPKQKLPLVPLSDGAGEVIETGPGATRVKVGDRVAAAFMPSWIDGEVDDLKSRSAMGAAAEGVASEYRVFSEQGLVAIPDYLSFEEAASLPCAGVTAWNALFETGSAKPGETVLTLGTGGVSMFALQFARMGGARVILTSSSDDKIARARELGAGEAVNYASTPDWEKRVRELTGGRGVDHVIEVGGAGTLGRSMRAVRTGGTISLIGVLAEGPGTNVTPVLMRHLRVQGIFVGSRVMFENMLKAMAARQLRPVVDRVFAFNELHDALRYRESARHFGKVCLASP
jgi:NADPH:quinone reductase-like Zn-dependent oxidoreductase